MARSVLIVDDSEPFRSVARRLLERDGFRVVGEAVDGSSALAVVRSMRPDVVLLDVQLPDLDGFAVCEAILSESTPPVVVMTSTRPLSAFRRRMDVSGAAAFIPKHDLVPGALAIAMDGG